MNKIATVLAFFIIVSCGQEKTNNDGQLNTSYQKSTEIKSPKTEEIKNEEAKILGTGKITSIADGFDIQRVNLFSSTSSSRTINCYLKDGDKVNIIEDADPYYFVEKADAKGCKGYCMKGFVILNK